MEPEAGLNTLDYAVVAVILVSGLAALMRGLVRELFSLVAWGGAYVFGTTFYPLAEPWVHKYVKNEATEHIAAGAVVFCIAFVTLSMLGAIVAHFIKGRTLTAIDRSLGFLYGLARGTVVVAVLYLVATTILWPNVDKPPSKEAVTLNAMPMPGPQNSAANAKRADNDKDSAPVPEWLLKAKTRPFMAFGAAQIAAYIPKEFLQKKTDEYLHQKDSAKRAIEETSHDVLLNSDGGSKAQP